MSRPREPQWRRREVPRRDIGWHAETRGYRKGDEPNSGLDPKTSLVIDELLQSITKEFNITTIINTHDMNSVMGIGENILFIYEGEKEWQGQSSQIMRSDNERLTDFIFASDLLKNMRQVVIKNGLEV